MNSALIEQKETFIEQELKKFNVVESKLAELADAGKGLTISGIDDKAGLEAVKKARIAIKNERVRIEKTGKSLRDQANAFNKAVLAKEKEYLSIIVPTEDALQAEEDRIANDKARIEREAEEAKQRVTQDRISQLYKYGHVIDYSRAEALTEEQFDQELSEAKNQYEAEQHRIAAEKEAARIESERLAEIARQQAIERQKLEEEKRKQEMEAQRLRLEAEKIEQQKRMADEKEIALRAAAERAERDKQAAIIAERDRIEREAAAKEQQAWAAEIERKRQESLAPDKEKLSKLSSLIDSFELPELSTPEAGRIISDVRSLLSKVSAYINQQIEKL